MPLGVVIMLICLSGATLVFKNEIRNALEMPKVIAPHAKSIKGDHDIKASDEERVGKTIGKFSSKDAPYGTTTKRDFFSYVTKFHTSLMMGPVGKLIITYTTLLFIFILITGVYLFFCRKTESSCANALRWNGTKEADAASSTFTSVLVGVHSFGCYFFLLRAWDLA